MEIGQVIEEGDRKVEVPEWEKSPQRVEPKPEIIPERIPEKVN